MPPKKTAADSADAAAPSSSSVAPMEEKAKAKSDAAAVRKLATHPSTVVMVKEALKELDSRKGVSSQAIQNYIKQKYPSVDLVRLKALVRRTLKKGIESGTLVRPANSSVTTGATGKFRLAPKAKEPKRKNENVDPNVQKAPKPAKDGAKKPPKAGANKKEDVTDQAKSVEKDSKPTKRSKSDEETATANKKEDVTDQAKSVEKDLKPTKRSKSDEETATAKGPGKKPKAKKAVEEEDDKGSPDASKTKAAKTNNGAKAGRASKTKAAKAASVAPATKATGKRGKRVVE